MQVETFQKYKTLTNQGLKALKVLVVDDDIMIRETLQLFLQNIDIGIVQTADSGETALLKINKEMYDYVFMDLMMPGLSGMEVLKEIHRDNQLTSVIIMTGYPSMDVVIDAMHHGASDFLVKPFQFQDVKLILERIERLRLLMEKNWLLHQELEEKKEVEELNNQLQKRIRHQTILYNIVDSLSTINRSEDLYQYLVKESKKSCNAKKVCFMIYGENNSQLLTLAHEGFKDPALEISTGIEEDSEGAGILDKNIIGAYFGQSADKWTPLDKIYRNNGSMLIPFNIRHEPFGLLFMTEKEGEKSFDEEDESILKFLSEKAALNIENIALYDNLKQSLRASFMSLVSAIEAKDLYTQQHSSRVTELSLKIAKKMECEYDDLQRLESSGPLHDIGKIGINDTILNKTDKLNEEEYTHIKTHPLIGVNIVSPLGLDYEELAIIRNHHERWDGKGYPDGLKGDEIPRLSRILSVADAFDAMSSSRAYRKALPFSVCINELKNKSGTQFDPDIIEAAIAAFTDDT